MPSFEIPDGPTTVPLKPGTANGQPVRTGTATYSITNKSTNGLSGRIGALVAGDAKAEWFQVEGEKERPFGPGETQTVTINVNVPASVKPGAYKFRPRIVAVNDPDNDHTDGPVASLQVVGAAPPPVGGKKPFPIWIIFVIFGAVVLIGGGITAYLIIKPDGGGKAVMPQVAELSVGDATAALGKLPFKVEIATEDTPNAEVAPGMVVGQDPAVDTPLKEGQKVTLKVATAPAETLVAAPVATGTDYREAVGALKASGFIAQPVSGAKNGSPPDQVFEQNPAAGAQMSKKTPIKLTYDPGVQVPNLSTGTKTFLQAAQSTSGRFVIDVGTAECQKADAPGEDIVSQDLPSDKIVARMSTIKVNVKLYQKETCPKRYWSVFEYNAKKSAMYSNAFSSMLKK